jgi:hypothetical protein
MPRLHSKNKKAKRGEIALTTGIIMEHTTAHYVHRPCSICTHPNPSKDDASRNVIAKAGFDCVCALQTRIISSVHFVFDYHPTKTCWTQDSLQQAFASPSY